MSQATWQLIMDSYSVRNNLVLQFKRDSIDQSPQLAETLFERFGRDGQLEFSRRVFRSAEVVVDPEGSERKLAKAFLFLFCCVAVVPLIIFILNESFSQQCLPAWQSQRSLSVIVNLRNNISVLCCNEHS